MWNILKRWFSICNHNYKAYEVYDLLKIDKDEKIGELIIYKCSLCSNIKSTRYHY